MLNYLDGLKDAIEIIENNPCNADGYHACSQQEAYKNLIRQQMDSFSYLANPVENRVMPENLRALERLTAKQALEIDDLKIKLADAEERIKDVLHRIVCIGAPLNDNYYGYNKDQLKIFFEIQQILSA